MRSVVQKSAMIVLAFAMVLLTACSVTVSISSGGSESKSGDSQSSSSISLVGAYVLDPDKAATDAGLDLSSIPESRRAVMVVYDVKPDASKNWQGTPDCSLSYQSGNKYTNASSDLPTQLQVFLSRDGYGSPNKKLALDAGTKTVRNCAVFLVNRTDVESSELGTLSIDLNGLDQLTEDLASSELRHISMPDEILQSEPDYAGYQQARSLEARASLCQISVNRGAAAIKSNRVAEAKTALVAAGAMFSEDVDWGLSLVSSGNSTDTTYVANNALPVLNYSQLSSYDSVLGADAEKAEQLLLNMQDSLDSEDYSQLNNSKNELQTTLNDMLAQCKQYIQ